MLARMNFAAQLATNQRFNLRDARAADGAVARGAALATCSTGSRRRRSRATSYDALLDYARAGGAWTGSDAQLATKAAGLAHLIVGSGEYQFV